MRFSRMAAAWFGFERCRSAGAGGLAAVHPAGAAGVAGAVVVVSTCFDPPHAGSTTSAASSAMGRFNLRPRRRARV